MISSSPRDIRLHGAVVGSLLRSHEHTDSPRPSSEQPGWNCNVCHHLRKTR
jgi:hypothetical protein